jgi:hypothetical protein
MPQIICNNIYEWQRKGHVYGECMSHPDIDLMYVNIPKNASSWTKPNLKDWDWQFYNYHTDHLNKHALVVLRDPIDRWISGIAEYLALYHPDFNAPFYETQRLIFDKIVFDDHTEKQIKFLDGLDTDNCTFMWCDNEYRNNFSRFITEHLGDNRYDRYDYQHVSRNDGTRYSHKLFFKNVLEKNPEYLENLKQYYAEDYNLINNVKFYNSL